MSFQDLALGPSGTRCIAEALIGSMPLMEGGFFLNRGTINGGSCKILDHGAVSLVRSLVDILDYD
jgi:hypothetical protein